MAVTTSEVKREASRVAVRAAFLASVAAFLTGCGGTTTTVTQDGHTTRTITHTDTLLIALITAGSALISALLTGLYGHISSIRRERLQAKRATSTESDRLLRETIGKVSTSIGAVMAIAHDVSSEAGDGANLEAAYIFEAGYRRLQKLRDEALPNIYLLEDEQLRDRAIEVVDLYGAWLWRSSEAMVNEIEQPSTQEAWDARDAFFERAREVMKSSALQLQQTVGQ